LIVFFSVFGRVSLAPRSQVTFDRAVLRRIAEEHLQRLGVSTPIRQVGGAIDPGQYVYVATKFGAPFARDAANNPVHYWTWSAAFDGGSLNVDNRGRLTSFSRQAIPIDPIRRTADDARRQALGAVQEFFGEPASGLTLEREQRGATFEFAWLGPDGPLRIRYTAAIDAGGVSSLAETVAAARGYSLESFPFGEVTMNEWGLPVAAVIGALLCAFGFVNRRRAQASAPWRTALSVAAFVAGAGYLLPGFRFFGIGDMIAIPLGVGLLFAVVVYFGAIGVETLSRRAAPHKLVTLTSLFGRERRIEMSSLAILRGCAVGLVLLGADTLVSWIATTSFHGRLSMIHVGLMGGIIGGSVWPEGLVLGICVLQMVGVSLLVASADAVAERVPVRGWIASIAAAALLAASGIRLSMGAVQPVRFTLAALLVDYALLLVAYRLFDLLTLCAAIGTFAFWWANYPLLVMQQPIGAAGPWTAFALWTIVVVAAAAIAFRSTLRSGYRRVAAALE
jgi:hypothetical protein